MNTKTTKFLAVVAALAVAFAFVALIPTPESDAASVATVQFEGDYVYNANVAAYNVNVDNEAFGNSLTFSNGTTSGNVTTYVVSGTLGHMSSSNAAFAALYGTGADTSTYTYLISMNITAVGGTAIDSYDVFKHSWTTSADRVYDESADFSDAPDRSGVNTSEVVVQSVSAANFLAGTYKYVHVGIWQKASAEDTQGTIYELIFDMSAAYPTVTSASEMTTALAGTIGTIYTTGFSDTTAAFEIKRDVKIVGIDTGSTEAAISGTLSGNCVFTIGDSSATAARTTALNVVIDNLSITAGEGKKVIYISEKTNLTVTNSTLSGWAGIYVLAPKTSATGTQWADGRWGADGTTITMKDSAIAATSFDMSGTAPEGWNNFGAITLHSQANVSLTGCMITLAKSDTGSNGHYLYVFDSGAYASVPAANNTVSIAGNGCDIQMNKCAVIYDPDLDGTGLYYYGWAAGYNTVGLAEDSNSVTVRNSVIGDLSGWTWSTTDSGSTWTYEAITPATFTVDGEEAEVVTDATIDATTSKAPIVIATSAVTSVTPAKDQTIILDNTSVLAAVDISNAGSIVTMNDSMTIPAGGLTVTAGDDSIVISAGATGIFTFTKGSVVVNGVGMSGTITISDGDVVKVSGTATGATVFALAGTSAKIIIENNTTLAATTGSITIPEGATLTVYGTLSGTIINNGEIILMTGGDVSGASITGTGTVTDKSDESDMEDIYVNGNTKSGTIDFPASQNVIVNGSWNLVSGAIVTINGQLVVPEGAKLTVEAGAILIIDNNANAYVEGTMIVEEGDSVDDAAILDIEYGTLEVEGTFNMNGDMTVSYASMKTGTVNITAEGNATFGKASTVTVEAGAELNVEPSAALTIKGSLDATIYNYGTITVATEIAAEDNSTIYLKSNGASVIIEKFTIGTTQKSLTITDDGLIYNYDKNAKKYYAVGRTSADAGYGDCTYNGVVTAPPVNTIVISATVGTAGFTAIVSNLKITEEVATSSSDYNTYYVESAERGYTSKMAISGDVAVAKAYIGEGEAGIYAKNATLTLNGGQGFAVNTGDKFVSEIDVTVANAGKFFVEGEVDVSAHTTESQTTFTNTGTVTVTGLGELTSNATLAGTVNACLINDVVLSYTYYVYYGIDAVIAVAAADPTVTEISVLGNNTVYVTATLPENVTMTLATGAYVTIGIDSSTILTIDNDAVIKGNGTIDVYGSLYAEDRTTVKGNTVISDVFSYEVDEKGKAVKNGWGLWTNIVTALNTAEAGDTIKISKTDGLVYVTGNVEIKEGVTLEIPEDAAPLFIYNGVTLTVNGILSTEVTIWAQNDFDITAKNVTTDRSSAIVVNGAILLSYEPNYLYTKNATLNTAKTTTNAQSLKAVGAPIAGAYYQTDDYYVISSPMYAMIALDDVITDITIKGKVTAEDLIFAETDNFSKIKVAAGIAGFDAPILTQFTFSSLTLDEVTLELTKGTVEIVANPANVAGYSGAVNGIVEVGDSAVTLKNVYARVTGATNAPTIKDSNGKLLISDYFMMVGGSITASAGTVYTGDNFASNQLGNTSTTSGTVNVASGATLIANSATAGSVHKMTVNGSLQVPNEKAFTVAALTIYGDVTVSPSTSTKSAGVLQLTQVFVGISSSSWTTASAAVLSGAFTVSGNLYAVVSADAEIDDAAATVLAAYPYTTFYVSDMPWITVYAAAASEKYIRAAAGVDDDGLYQFVPKALEDCEFVAWQYLSSGELKDVPAGTLIGASSTYNAVYADINYNIYGVRVVTDEGVKSVAIDGIQMIWNNDNTFTQLNRLMAGDHTISYTLKDGYEGTPNLYTSGGLILQNYKFTVHGTDADDVDITLQLSGTQKEVTPEPEPTPTPEKESEWNVTTILLLVLVILIAIMAVIVALRLNRS